ncbi:unnamed protein product [Lupinus luteus]|uniref:Uncharacterized protein n=1 Tax=Lupinus luteus TaxID=3873 RepID=A0AAV1WZK9_LUPLU
MHQDRSKGTGEVLDHFYEGIDESLSILVEGVAIHAVDGGSLGGRACKSGEVGTSKEMGNGFGLNKELTEWGEEVQGPGEKSTLDIDVIEENCDKS